MLSDLVHPSHVNASVHFPWSSPQSDVGGTQRNEGAIAKSNRQTTPTEWQVIEPHSISPEYPFRISIASKIFNETFGLEGL